MVRFVVLTLVAMSLGLTGCQKAKMSKVTKKPGVHTQGGPHPGPRPHPPVYYPPRQQQPPQTFQPPPPAPPQTRIPPQIDPPDYEAPRQDSMNPGDYEGRVNPLPQFGDRPDLDGSNQTDYTDYSKLPRVLDTCRYGCAPVEPQPEEDCRENSKCKEEPQPVPGECAPILVKGKAKAQKLDIVFVVDTSLSMRKLKKETGTSELADMAAQMGEFVRQLDPSTDYNIGVLLAHGPATNKSPNNFHGKLFRKGDSDKSVISIGSLIAQARSKGASESEARTRAEAQVVSLLKNKMLSLDRSTDDRTSAQGEVGLFSLYSAATDSQLRNDIKAKGLFRDDAALNVIFVSDENDVCYDYHGRSPRVADRHEKITFDGLCSTAANGQRLTEDDVLDALKVLKKGQPLILSGIIYTDVNTLPAVGPNDENEIGWGYKDIVEKAHGKQGKGNVVGLADLAGRDYGKALVQLGRFAQHKIDYEDFRCVTKSKVENINSTSFDILLYTEKARIGRFNAACGVGKNSNSCPKGAKPIRSIRVDNGTYILSVDPSDMQRAMGKADEKGAHAKITFMKLEEDGIARDQQIQELRSQAESQNQQPVVERSEEDFEETEGEVAGDAAGAAAADAEAMAKADAETDEDAPPVVKPSPQGKPKAKAKK